MSNKTLSTINPFTGEVTPLGDPISSLSWYTMGTDTLDYINNQYIFRGGYAGENDNRLFMIDTLTGSLLSDTIIHEDFTMAQYNPLRN